MRRNCTLVCAVRSIGVRTRVCVQCGCTIWERLLALLTDQVRPSLTADDRHLPHDAHGGQPHARKSGHAVAILEYSAHNDTYQRLAEYHLDRRREKQRRMRAVSGLQ